MRSFEMGTVLTKICSHTFDEDTMQWLPKKRAGSSTGGEEELAKVEDEFVEDMN